MKRPWFKFYPSDWLNGTRGLSLEERGAYMTLIALMYDQQGAIPDDERWMCGALDCDVRVWRRLRDKLCRYGKITPNTDGFLVNRRVLEELRSAELVAEVRRKSGRSGGQQSGKSRANPLKDMRQDEANASNRLLYARALPESEDILSSEAKASSESPIALISSKRDDVREAVEAWDEAAQRQGWTRIAKVTPARRQMIQARLREHGLDVWRSMVARLSKAEWANDPTKRDPKHANWKPHIDWFAKSSVFLRLVEGSYGGAEEAPNYAAALRIWDKSDHTHWDRAKYGPAPNEPGYRGPPIEPADLFKAQGAKP
jgi:uncharacterized protein YdaU (DUF1376 family)